MGYAVYVFVLSALAAVIIAQNPAFVTFQNPQVSSGTASSVQPSTAGYLVTLQSAGWIYGNPISLYPTGPTVSYTTLLASQGTTGIGLVGATCSQDYTAATYAQQTLVGQGAGALSQACPADFATLYTPATPAGSTSSTNLAGSALVVDDPVRWTLTQPAAATTTTAGVTTNNVIGVQVLNFATGTAAANAITASTDTQQATTGNGAQQFALAGIQYAFYLETTGFAQACFQSEVQFQTSPGDCGEQLFVVGHSDQSAGKLSISFAVLFALIAFVLYN